MLATCLILILPLWITPFNPLVDYPFHLARVWILQHYDQVPSFQGAFGRINGPIPNLGIDLFVFPLLRWLPPVIAGKLFLTAIVLVFSWGCHLLGTATLHRSWLAPMAAFSVYSSSLLYGFVNSVFALGLFLLTFGLWLRWRNTWTPVRWCVVTGLSVATYFSHLSGFAFLGLCIGSISAWEVVSTRRVTRGTVAGAAVLAPAIAVQLYPWHDALHIGRLIIWSGLSDKAIAIASPFLGYNYKLDAAAALVLFSVLLYCAIRGRLSVTPVLFGPALVLLAGFLLCPKQLTPEGGSAADGRFIAPAFVLLLLSLTVTLPRHGKLVLSIAFVAVLLRIGDISWHWREMARSTAAMVSALERVEPSSRIYVLFPMPLNNEHNKILRSNLHAASYAIIARQAIPSNFYAVRGAQLLYFREPSRWAADESPQVFDQQYLNRHLGGFDYLWGCNLDERYLSYIRPRAAFVADGDICSLWKLPKPQSLPTNASLRSRQ